ncbi:hypothetical protein SAMN04487949_1967 [Halogranum gelatinilyticum]|uniref:Uncharacterized protein n=1 Tax=Halogranum gelatinilyticum TaxID=660521 RepID=A0A1G9TYK9_9EURY|nr:hypothetical protein [Halogranum gelatinilyticum]SDM52762.1 hypothetical protein SAMN04487949_1967 [Halogranum gelatinilyticum]
MDLSRRKMLSLGAITGLAGCNALGGSNDGNSVAGDAGSSDAVAQQDGQYFDEDGALTAPVNNETVATDSVSPNVGAGFELVAYRDGETAYVVDGLTREVLYSGDDIGTIVNQVQEDFPRGVHLHLTDLFEYSENIVISTPMKLTGERAVTNFSKQGADAIAVDPVGLKFTGSGVAVAVYNGEQGVRGVHVEDLFVHAESGTVAFRLFGETAGSTYSPFADSIFHNIVTEGGSEAGIELVGSIFNCTFGDLRAFGAGGHGIWLNVGEGGGFPGLSTFSLLRSKFCDGDGVRIDGIGLSVVDRIYTNFAKGRGVYLGMEGTDTVFHRIMGEVNEGADVEVDELLGGRIDRIYGRGGEPVPPSIDYQGPAVRLSMYDGSIGDVLAQAGDLVVDGLQAGSEIESLELQNGAELDIAANSVFDSEIHQIRTEGDSKPTFNEATLTDDGRGQVRFNFDTRFTEPPTLSFGRRGGGIEDVSYAKTSADGQFYAADIELAETGGTVDVTAEMSGKL